MATVGEMDSWSDKKFGEYHGVNQAGSLPPRPPVANFQRTGKTCVAVISYTQMMEKGPQRRDVIKVRKKVGH